jgi:quercetin dioxygenase-like cupin family protein
MVVPPTAPGELVQPAGERIEGILTRSGDAHGVHFTASVDFVTVISGELTLELDGGVQIPLKTGDAVVQNGTAHAWRNNGDGPAIAGVIAIGVHHDRVHPPRPGAAAETAEVNE